ncbi:large conductance mechanosensitive channel protein MscL [Longivirga aurantiaca]|uniref:Large-conductance mechanosensitive channel n=1 Tax=Longivirga aurantiaca TaxID=1837743 RepID=A0ABW1SXE4_9ACTN
MVKGFRDFLMRGNVVDLAVAVVIGAAFGAVIKAFTDGLLNPLIAAIFGKPSLNEVGTFTINGAVFSIGLVLTALINFVIIAAAIYFFVIVPINAIKARSAKEEEAETAEEIVLLREIRDSLKQQG